MKCDRNNKVEVEVESMNHSQIDFSCSFQSKFHKMCVVITDLQGLIFPSECERKLHHRPMFLYKHKTRQIDFCIFPFSSCHVVIGSGKGREKSTKQ